jgi:hypothetical protein
MTVACCALLLLGYGLGAGGSVLAAVAILLAGAAAISVFKFSLSRLLFATTCAAAFVTGLPEIYFGPVRVRLALVILALLLAVASLVRGARLWLPWWILTPAGAIVLATALVLMFPIPEAYLSTRVVGVAFGPQTAADIGPAMSAILSIVGLPLAAIASSLAFRRAPLWIAFAFVAGNSLSAVAAYTDFLGLTALSAAFGGCGVPGGRACGFSSHPVLLTIGTVYSAGLAAWFLVRPSVRSRIFGAISLSALVLGTYASGTRGGVLSIAFLIAASVLMLPQYRRHIHWVLLGTATAASVVFVIIPGLGRQLLMTTRFIDSPTAAGSNRARIDLMSQGWHDFLESPIYGIGFHVLFQAHNGYIQSLASGGLILLIGMLALQFGALWESFRLMKTEAMATALAATMLTRIGYEAVEGALVHYAALVPIALIAALLAQQRHADADVGSRESTAVLTTRSSARGIRHTQSESARWR